MIDKAKELEDLFLQFQREWPLERVEKMTLEEYTSVKKDNPDRNDFTFWIENKLDNIGSIWGGSAFKFGIYKRDDKIDKDLKGRKYTQEYAWWSKYGDNPQEAFNRVKNIVKQIIKASQNNDLKTIQNIKDLGHSIKWKIAFHYQNIEDIKIINIFSRGVLEAISKDRYGVKLKTCEIYKKLLDDKEKYNLAEVLEISDKLWKTYGSKPNIDKDNQEELNAYEEEDKMHLNQILYGPPGTGKTYHTIDKALEILGENLESRDEKKAKFDEYVKNGQIVFTTFHQSYGYEEFIEGIKPVMDSEQGNSKEVEYEIKDGVFKELCNEALKSLKRFEEIKNEFLNHCRKEKSITHKDREYKFQEPNNLTIGNLQIHINYLRDMIDQIGLSYIGLSDMERDRYIRMKINSGDNIINNYKVILDYFYCKHINIKDFSFVFIIDEINRGNVSKIFGELITLIEPSKRIGESEELKVTLPYSGEKFGVPKNVYIIGTMNTADRSITSLDTALRRRFEFVEMMPDVSKLSTDCEDVNLQELLKAINTRIEYLLDREKTIGHAFFIDVKNLEDLKKVFQNKIIPLLQEYFYNDYALIDAVLNDNGMLIKENNLENDYLKNIKEFIDSDKIIWDFSPSQDWNENTFKKIYE